MKFIKNTSILRKAIMALTGLGLIGFLITHLAGNLYLYMGADKFNGYSKFLEENPFLIVAELGLIALFVIHIKTAISVTLANRAARPQPYEVKKTAGQSTLASRTMIISGFVILVFVIFHVKGFKFGDRPNPSTLWPHGSLWELVVEKFSDPGIAAFYVVCMLVLGLRNASGRPRLGGVGALIGWALALSFAAFPIWVQVTKPVAKPAVPIGVKDNLEPAAVKKNSAE